MQQKIGIVNPSAAINGIVSVQKLSRGISSVAVPLTQWATKSLANSSAIWGSSLQIVNGFLYVIGGHSGSSWDNTTGDAVIQRWDMNPANAFTVVYNPGNTSIAGTNYSTVIGNFIYFIRGSGDGQSLYRFNTADNTLTTMASRSVVHNLNNIVANSDGTKIYQFGAHGAGNTNAAEVYTVANNTWATIADAPGTWGSGSYRDQSNPLRMYPYGNTGQTTRWRYNADTNTYTNLGGANESFYANTGNHSISGSFFIQAVTTAGDPTSQFKAIKTDGTSNSQFIYTPTAAALIRDSVITGLESTNAGCSVAVGSTYTAVHAGAQSVIYYTPTSAFLGGFN